MRIFDPVETGDQRIRTCTFSGHPGLTAGLSDTQSPSGGRNAKLSRPGVFPRTSPDRQATYHHSGTHDDVCKQLIHGSLSTDKFARVHFRGVYQVSVFLSTTTQWISSTGPLTAHKNSAYAQTKELATALVAKHGRLMLSPTHVLEPEMPPGNVKACFDACDALTC